MEVSAVVHVGCVQLLGGQDLDELAEQLLSPVAKQPIRLGVDERDAIIVVNDHNSVRRRLHEFRR